MPNPQRPNQPSSRPEQPQRNTNPHRPSEPQRRPDERRSDQKR